MFFKYLRTMEVSQLVILSGRPTTTKRHWKFVPFISKADGGTGKMSQVTSCTVGVYMYRFVSSKYRVVYYIQSTCIIVCRSVIHRSVRALNSLILLILSVQPHQPGCLNFRLLNKNADELINMQKCHVSHTRTHNYVKPNNTQAINT